MNIFLSTHAKERMSERVLCSDAKKLKLAYKAWRSTARVENVYKLDKEYE